MDDLYQAQILDHYKNPRNFGKLKNANLEASDNLVSCGDKLSMEFFIKDKKVVDVKFQGVGCAISMAAASMLTEILKNKNISDLKRLKSDDILKLLRINLSATRMKCAMLSLEVLKKALQK